MKIKMKAEKQEKVIDVLSKNWTNEFANYELDALTIHAWNETNIFSPSQTNTIKSQEILKVIAPVMAK